MPGGVGGAVPRGALLSRSLALSAPQADLRLAEGNSSSADTRQRRFIPRMTHSAIVHASIRRSRTNIGYSVGFLANNLDGVVPHGDCYQVPNVLFSFDPTANRIYFDNRLEVVETIEQAFIFFSFNDLCIME